MFESRPSTPDSLVQPKKQIRVPEWLPFPLFFLGTPALLIPASILTARLGRLEGWDPDMTIGGILLLDIFLLLAIGCGAMCLEAIGNDQELARETCAVSEGDVYSVVLPSGHGGYQDQFGYHDQMGDLLNETFYTGGREIPLGEIFSAIEETSVTIISRGQQNFVVRMANATKGGAEGVVSPTAMVAFLELAQKNARRTERF